ncbi:MAG: glycosyltransferase family 39 protein [Verrucomicrobiales bacterium]
MNALRHATTFARDLPARCGIGSAALFWALVAVLVASAAWMLGHDPPWDSEAARRIAEGKKLKPEHYGATGLWWAAAANALLAAGALAFAKLWSPGLAAADPAPLLEPGRGRKAFAFTLLAAVLCGAILRAPRLTHSLWNDEEYSARTYVWGKFEPGGGGALEFKPVTWAEAAWKNKVNNHLLHTFEARLSLKAWQAMAGRGPEAFSEAALRFFPFLSGVGTIALVGLLGAMAAGPRAGIAAAILLAISPWHLRYSVEARGYATMMFCMAAALCCLLPALRTGRWRWWLGYAAAQAGYLLCFLGSIYVFALGNAAAAAIILAGRGYRGARGRWLSRLGVANVATLLLFAPAIAPSVPQIAEYMDDPIAVEGGMGAAWLRDFWTHLTLGFPWESQLDGEHLGTSAETLGKANILAKAWVAWIAPVLGGAGIALLLWRGWRGRLIAAALAGGAAAAVAESWATGSPMHIWYLIYATMALAIALGVAAAEAARLGRWAQIGAPALLILCAGYACADPLYASAPSTASRCARSSKRSGARRRRPARTMARS